jgi:hypothetical protein
MDELAPGVYVVVIETTTRVLTWSFQIMALPSAPVIDVAAVPRDLWAGWTPSAGADRYRVRASFPTCCIGIGSAITAATTAAFPVQADNLSFGEPVVMVEAGSRYGFGRWSQRSTAPLAAPAVEVVGTSPSSVSVTIRGLPGAGFFLRDVPLNGAPLEIKDVHTTSPLDDSGTTTLVYQFLAPSTPVAFDVVLLDRFGRPSPVVRVSGSTLPEFPLPPACGSKAALRDQVQRLYAAFFLRCADEAGASFWESRRAAGTSLTAIADEFARAPEFVARYGAMDDAQFVDFVYKNVLGRRADREGFSFWRLRLFVGADTRGSMMAGFSESPEFVGRSGTTPPHDPLEGRLRRLYKAYFLRDPDSSGLAFWLGQLRAGMTIAKAADLFGQSAEFQARYGSLDDAAFVQLIYRNVLGRDAEPSGAAFWTGQLGARKLTRGGVMVGFSDSAEFIVRTGTIPPF